MSQSGYSSSCLVGFFVCFFLSEGGGNGGFLPFDYICKVHSVKPALVTTSFKQ